MPDICNRFLERIEGSKNFASVRITPNPKSLMLGGRTFDLACHDGKLRLSSTLFPIF